MTFLRRLLGLAFVGSLAPTTPLAAEVIVKVRPPHVVVERHPAPPSRNHVWISGYHRWDGRTYVWVPGRWELAPRRRAHWVPHHWVHRRGGWVLVEGHWS